MFELDRSRRGLVSHLVELAAGAGRALVHGPWGIGKTTLLLETARAGRAAGLRTAYCGQTRALADVVATLAQLYGDSGAAKSSAKRRRSSLRMATEVDAGLILLDGFQARGTALVGFLRSLRGKRLAVIAAADVEDPRDLAAVRAVDIGYREFVVPPLPARALKQHFDRLLEAMAPPMEISDDARRALLRLAGGCPGILERAWARLQDQRYWRGAAPLLESIRVDLRLEWLAATRATDRNAGRLN